MKYRVLNGFEPGDMTLPQALVAGWRLMTVSEQRKAMVIGAMSATAGAIELFSVIAVYPLVSVLIDPSTLKTNETFAKVWRLVGEPTTETFVIEFAALAAILLVVGSVISFLSQVAVNRFAAACQERLGCDLLAALFSAPYMWFIQHNPLLLSNLFLNHVTVWSRDFVRRTLAMTGQLAAIVMPIALLIAFAPAVGIGVLVLAGGITMAMLTYIKRRTLKLMNDKRIADERSLIFLNESLQGIKDVKLSSREEAFLKMFAHTYHVSSRTFAASNNWNLIPVQLVMVPGQIAILGVALGLFLAGTDGATLASVTALVALIGSRIVPAMNRFGAGVNAIANMKSWVEVLWAVHTNVHAARAAAQPVSLEPMDKPLDWRRLRLEDVNFVYPRSNNQTLHAVTLEIERGRSYAFVGPTGAGKSTCIDIILGLLDPSAGRVLLDGVPLNEIGLRRWQKRIGFVPQAPLITESSLKSNVAFGVPESRIDEKKVHRCLALTNLTEVVKGLPRGIDTPLGDRGHRLSGGQRQCVAIARALYNDPDILVLDEATSALDTLSEGAIRGALLNLHGRVTAISIAHRFSTIESCDRIFLMDAGRLVAEGSYTELMVESDLFSRLAQPREHIEPKAAANA